MATATLLTTTQLQEHLQSDLSDDALQRLLDSEESEIIRRYGAHAAANAMLAGGGDRLVLPRQTASITTVIETVSDEDTTLSANDHRLWHDAVLERLDTGDNPRDEWGDRVTVTYVPEDRAAQRKLALVQLCKLAAAYEGLASEGVGGSDYSMTALDYRRERERLLAALRPRGIVFA